MEANNKTMREALTKISESATYALKYRHKGLDYGDLQGFIEEMGEDARAALAAPPRNCDVYTHDEALEVWAAENENERNGCFDEWLYHVATKKEGKADGSK